MAQIEILISWTVIYALDGEGCEFPYVLTKDGL
jgi:hypothetical protein